MLPFNDYATNFASHLFSPSLPIDTLFHEAAPSALSLIEKCRHTLIIFEFQSLLTDRKF